MSMIFLEKTAGTLEGKRVYFKYNNKVYSLLGHDGTTYGYPLNFVKKYNGEIYSFKRLALILNAQFFSTLISRKYVSGLDENLNNSIYGVENGNRIQSVGNVYSSLIKDFSKSDIGNDDFIGIDEKKMLICPTGTSNIFRFDTYLSLKYRAFSFNVNVLKTIKEDFSVCGIGVPTGVPGIGYPLCVFVNSGKLYFSTDGIQSDRTDLNTNLEYNVFKNYTIAFDYVGSINKIHIYIDGELKKSIEYRDSISFSRSLTFGTCYYRGSTRPEYDNLVGSRVLVSPNVGIFTLKSEATGSVDDLSEEIKKFMKLDPNHGKRTDELF